MKYFQRFKGLIFIALTCFITAKGSTVVSLTTKIDAQKDENSTGYNLAVSAGQTDDKQASANLTICGENSKVSIEKKGIVTLVAGRSIILHPGTKISSGSFLYASIESVTKIGKHSKSEVTLVTLEELEKIEEQASLSTAYFLFSPFPTRTKGHFHAGDDEQGSYTLSNNQLSAVYPEQHRKVAVDSRQLSEISRKQIPLNNTRTLMACCCRTENMRVLRL